MPMPRKSEAQHALHGTKPHDRAADLSYVPAGRPKFPKDLDSSLRPVFKRLCRLLLERRALTAGDADLIRLYCVVFDRHQRNSTKLREEGELTTYIRLDSNGVAHPQVKTNLRLKICTDAERQMAAILNQLGLTPTAKDRAKPVTGEVSKREVIPGSIEDLMPHLLGKGPDPEPFIMRPPLFDEDLEEKEAPMTREDGGGTE